MKLNIYITDPVDFCKGGHNLRNAFTALAMDPERTAPDRWVYVQTIELDESLIDTNKVRAIAMADIDEKERELRAVYASRLADIERHRGELLALEVKR